MTANLWADRLDVTRFGAVIDRVDPDVLAVQELQPEAAAVITARFDHHGLSPHHETLGTGIATRRPAVFAPLPNAYRDGWEARLDPADWPGLSVPLRVLCVHFANPIRFPFWLSLARRRRQLGDLLPHLEGDDALVVVGDLNASPVWPVYRRLAERLEDGPLAAGTAARTWRFQGFGPLLLRIDHGFSRRVTTVRSSTHRIPGSDHLALVLDVVVDTETGSGAGVGPDGEIADQIELLGGDRLHRQP